MALVLTLDLVSYRPAGGPAWLLFRATPCLSRGLANAPRNRYRQFFVTEGSVEFPYDLTADYTAKLGALQSGKTLWVEVIGISSAGIRNAPLEVRVDVP